MAQSDRSDVVEDAERCDDSGAAVTAKASSSMLGLGAVVLSKSGMAVQSSFLLLSLLQGTENCEVGALESTMGDPLIKRYRARGTDESRHRRPGYPRP